MKLFIYKILTAFILFFILYKLTIGHTIRLVEEKITNLYSKENVEYIKDKIREEIKNGTKKETLISSEDAKLLNNFLIKIQTELKKLNNK